MKQSYALWATVSIIASLIVIAGYYSYLKSSRHDSNADPTPSTSATPLSDSSTSPSPEASPRSGVTATPASNADQAKAAYQKKDYATAIAKYKLAIGETTDTKVQGELWNLLGNAYRDDKNTTEAIKSYEQAFKLNPNLIASYVNLSNVYVSQNNKTKARATLEAGLKANPNNSDLERELSIMNLGGTEGV